MSMTETAERQATATAKPTTTQPGSALTPGAAIRQGLEVMRPQFAVQLPKHISPERFERTVLTAVNNNPDLLAADKRSLFNACSKAAQDGLLPDGREGALVIFKDKTGKKLVQWMPMVFGLIKLMRQSGEIDSIGSRLVFQKELEVETDTNGDVIFDRDGQPHRRFRYFIAEGKEYLTHEPILFGERGEKVLVYAYARWKDGHVDYLPMHRDDVLKRKKASRAKSEFAPWNTWEDEMWLKTPLRAIANKLPRSSAILRALDRDEEPTEFEKLKNEAVQSIDAAAKMFGAPNVLTDQSDDIVDGEIVDAETGEIADAGTADAVAESDAPPQKTNGKK